MRSWSPLSRLALVVVLASSSAAALAADRSSAAPDNNLATPALFAEGLGLTGESVAIATGLRGTMGELETSIKPILVDGMPCWPQGVEGATWQAGWHSGSRASASALAAVRWTDRLTTRVPRSGERLPLEVALYVVDADVMAGFEMMYLWGKPPNEVWGTSGHTYKTHWETVFSAGARLVIQEIAFGTAEEKEPSWSPKLGYWVGGGALEPIVQTGVWESFPSKEPSAFRGNVDKEGLLGYLYGWDVPWLGHAGTATFRITFVLDGLGGPVEPNALFVEKTLPMPPASGSLLHAPVVVPAANLTYVDVTVVDFASP